MFAISSINELVEILDSGGLRRGSSRSGDLPQISHVTSRHTTSIASTISCDKARTRRKVDCGKDKERISRIPSLRNRFFCSVAIQLSLSWLWALHKGALLSVELAQHTTRLPLIDLTPALPPPTRIARTVLPTSCIDSRLRRCRTAHACRER